MRRIFLFLLLVPLFGNAQRQQIDSIRKVLSVSPDDTAKVKMLSDLGWDYMNLGNFDSALLYVNDAVKLANTPLQNGKPWLWGIAYANNTLGVIFFNKGFYPAALQHYFAALRIQEKLHDKKAIASIQNGIGNIFGIQHQFDQALKYHQAALQIRKEIGNKRGMANSYGNIGNLYYNKNNFSEALRNYYLSLALMQETSNKHGIANVYGNIGLVYLAEERFEDALKNQQASLRMHQALEDVQGEGVTYINIAIIYSKLEQYTKAEQYALKAADIAKEIGDLESLKDALFALSEIYEKTGKFGQALTNYKSFVNARDSLLNEENTRESIRLEMNYEFYKREAATRLEQEKKEAITAAESYRQKIILFAVSSFGLLVLVFGIFAYRSYLQKQKANLAIIQQKELIEEKQREILDSIQYARRIQTALFTSEKYIARCLRG